jgi:hypothetical protein
MRSICFALAALVAGGLAGCGDSNSGPANVSGQVVKNGAPLTLGENESVTITLTADDGKTTYTAGAGQDGKFTVQKPAGGPIPAGKYKVRFTHQDNPPPGSKKAGFKVSKDVEPWDVSSSGSTHTLDVGK